MFFFLTLDVFFCFPFFNLCHQEQHYCGCVKPGTAANDIRYQLMVSLNIIVQHAIHVLLKYIILSLFSFFNFNFITVLFSSSTQRRMLLMLLLVLVSSHCCDAAVVSPTRRTPKHASPSLVPPSFPIWRGWS